MTLSEIIDGLTGFVDDMDGRYPDPMVNAHKATVVALIEFEKRIAALETGQPTVERRKPGRPRKNLEANPG